MSTSFYIIGSLASYTFLLLAQLATKHPLWFSLVYARSDSIHNVCPFCIIDVVRLAYKTDDCLELVVKSKKQQWSFNNYTMEKFCFSSNACNKDTFLRLYFGIDLQILIPVAVVERTHSGGTSLSPTIVNQRTEIKSSSKFDNAHH